MALGRCEIAASSRSRSAGSEVRMTMRLDRTATIEFIRELAASIGLQVTLSPANTPDREAGR